MTVFPLFLQRFPEVRMLPAADAQGTGPSIALQSAFELKRLVKQTILQIVHTKREPTMQEGQETPIRSHIRSRSSTLHQEKPRIHRTRETRWSSRDSLPYAQKERTKPHAFRLILPSRPRLLQNDSFSARSIQFPSGGRISRTGHTVKSATRIVRPPSDALKKAPHHMMQRLEALDGCRPNEFRESSQW